MDGIDTEDIASIGTQDMADLLSENGSISRNSSPTLSEEDLLNIPDNQPAYSLRKRTERKAAFTFLDQDTSGNFDPSTEKQNFKKKKKKEKVRSRRKTSKSTARTSKAQDEADPFRETNANEDISEDPEDLILQLESRSPSPDILEDSAGHRGVVTKIMTSFIHPIIFNVGNGSISISDCNFCELPTYGFVGSFEKEVHCIRWDDGLGFTELAVTGGRKDQIQTTMCQFCTMSRVQIVACDGHDIHCITPPPALDFEETFDELLADEQPTTIRQQLSRWCSMCFSPAAFACYLPQASFFDEDQDTMIDGCGLKLCVACETQLREVFDGNSSLMAATLDHQSKAREKDEDLHARVRADVGFLDSDGILMNNVRYASEEVNA